MLLHGQHSFGELRLEVKDPSGAVMEISGKLRDLARGTDRSFRTDVRGRHTFADLPFGRYRVEVQSAGFSTQTLPIEVASKTPILRTITMTVGPAAGSAITVVGTTPLAGVGLAPEQIPAPVQAANRLEIEKSGAADLSDFLNRRLTAVHVNEIQGNPFQPDVNYRGYTASPLLGTPQGLSVYVDGVRLNQPFGDVVSWDLIPRIAIEETTLMPGSNPLFGLNTLGGALSIHTKDGVSGPGAALQLNGGSFGRKTADFEHGGSRANGLNWYLAGNLYFEDGWRDGSPSNVRQFFAKPGWQNSRTTLALTAAYVNNSLNGNGMQEQRLLSRDHASVYTKPDFTGNRATFLNLSARHRAGNSKTLSGNAYHRFIRTRSFNGDLNEDSLDQSVYQPGAAERAALTAAGFTGFPASGATAANTPFPFWRCIGNALLQDEPGEKCNALLNRTNTSQHNYGFSGQATWFASSSGRRNQFTAGAAYDRSNVGFRQLTELGYLNPDRSVTGVGAFGDGVTGGTVDDEPYDTRVRLDGRVHSGSLFVTDTLSAGNRWNFTAAGRYNRTTLDNSDRIRPSAGPGSLTGRSVFGRFNPAAGVTFRAWGDLNAYFSYGEGSRAPTSIELGCADPEQPCKLPNAMAGDPPLNQVVTRTFESGVRGGLESNLRWDIGWFRADNRNDLLFVASRQTGFGYFKNFGKTRRQGFEANARVRWGRVAPSAGYTLLDATYESTETVNGSSNSSNDAPAKGLDGVTRIGPGDRIPLIPRHALKAFVDIQATSNMGVDFGLVAMSRSYARGNENNLHEPDGTHYLGPGSSPGFAVANLNARYQASRRVQLFVQVNNVFDRRYSSAAILGVTGFTAQGTFIAREFPPVDGEYPARHATFYAPGAPRAVWGGARIRF